jgi:hypothetical protein
MQYFLIYFGIDVSIIGYINDADTEYILDLPP